MSTYNDLLKFQISPVGSVGRESARNVGDLGSVPGSGRSPSEGHGYPLMYSCLENPIDRGAWWAAINGVSESDMTEQLTHVMGLRKCIEC